MIVTIQSSSATYSSLLPSFLVPHPAQQLVLHSARAALPAVSVLPQRAPAPRLCCLQPKLCCLQPGLWPVLPDSSTTSRTSTSSTGQDLDLTLHQGKQVQLESEFGEQTHMHAHRMCSSASSTWHAAVQLFLFSEIFLNSRLRIPIGRTILESR